ncbi:3'-5' exonuclease [Rhodoblastus acidophilus]|uniref:3'-5' exonuclease n=1 Tax=Rhodoblastus acidophilus TaxID=1074 RepID=UPI001FCED08B|nr:3'-5' exonuclease [Rhodoblastus acidophilus]
MVEEVLAQTDIGVPQGRVSEPASNRGYMSRTLKEYWPAVTTADIFDYRADPETIDPQDFVADFLAPGDTPAASAEIVISNPPFTAAAAFIARALALPDWRLVAMLTRSSFVEGEARYRQLLRASKAEDAAGRLENLEELVSLASSFHSARELLDHAALATNRASEGATPAVRLMTMHRAKGLEFDQVFLPAFENGIIPSTYGDADEERRLAYVALTRGKRHVTISSAQFRRGPSEPSIFIAEIPDHAKERAKHASDRQGRPQLSPQRAQALRDLRARMRSF